MKTKTRISLAILVFFTFLQQSFAQTTLAPGDLSIIAFNSTDPDQFAFVLLRDIASGTAINFTDNGFSSTTTGRTGEGYLTYTAPAAICAGTVIVWTNGMSIAGTGWNSNNPTNFAFNNAGEQLFAFQGSTANWSTQNSITLLYGIQTAGNWLTTGTAAATTSYQPINLGASFKVVFPVNNNLALTSTSLSGTSADIISQLGLLTNYTLASHPTRLTIPSYISFTLFSANFSYAQSPMCSNDVGLELPTFVGIAGGTFAGNNGLVINSSTGGITPSANNAGSFAVSYTIVSAVGCPNLTSSTPVTITQLPAASISYSGTPFCSNAGQQVPNLIGNNSGTYSSTNGLSILSNGSISPSNSTPGSYTVTYSIPANAGCAQVDETASVAVTALPDPSFSYASPTYCSNGSTVLPTISGTLGGSFSSSFGLSLQASTGEIDPVSSVPGTYSVQYTLAAVGGCSAQSSTQSIIIESEASASLSYTNSPYCSNSSLVQAVLTGSNGGAFSSTSGISLDASTGEFNPGASNPGTYTITYAIPASLACPAFSTTATIDITALPTATIAYAGPFCTSASVQAVSISGTLGGSYSSTSGLAINSGTGEIDPSSSTAGTYTVTYTMAAANGCQAQTANNSVSITDPNPPAIAYSGVSFCNDGSSVSVVQTGASGGSYSSSVGLSVDAGSGQLNLSQSTAGNYTVVYSVPASGGCATQTANTSLTIVQAPTATVSYANNPYCLTGANPSVTLIGTQGGTFSTTAGLSINASSGAIDLSQSTIGTYQISYTIPASNGCNSVTTTTTVQVNSPGTASVSYNGSPFCSNASPVLPVLTGSTGGSFSSTIGLVINATTGEINFSNSQAGSYVVTYFLPAAGGCASQTFTTNVTIDQLPTATLSYANPQFCTTSLPGLPSLTGTSGGTYSSTSGLTIDVNTGTITPNTSSAGSYTVTYTMASSGACASQTAATNVTVSAPILTLVSYGNGQICPESQSVLPTITGIQGGIFSASNGLFINASTGEITPVSANSGTYIVNYQTPSGANGGCPQTTASQVITIQSPITPVISALGSTNLCGTGQSVALVSNYANGNSWNIGGNNDTLLVSQAGSIVLTVTDANGCTGVSAPFTVNSASALDTTVSVVGNTITSNESNASYQWYFCSSSLVELPGENQQSFTANQSGDYAAVISVNGCTATTACTNILYVGQETIEKEGWLVYPNPSQGKIRVSYSQNPGRFSLNIYSIQGSKLLSEVESEENGELDLGRLSDGVYFLELIGERRRLIKWVKGGVE
jgi:hypothetical protein